MARVITAITVNPGVFRNWQPPNLKPFRRLRTTLPLLFAWTYSYLNACIGSMRVARRAGR
jgi:hypothetical protein